VKPNQWQWSSSGDDLASALDSLRYPGEVADLLSRELGALQAADQKRTLISDSPGILTGD